MRPTPTLELKLYDETDAPDLVSGYNASMFTLDESRILCFKRPLAGTDDLNDIKNTGYYNDAPNVIPANAAPGLTRPVCYIVLDTSMATGMGDSTTQIAVGTPVAGKDNMLIRSYHGSIGWTEWLPVSAEQASSWAEVTGKPFSTAGKALTTRDNTLDLSTAAQASFVPEGGAAGQVLVKKSDTDHDCVWANPSALNTIHEIKTVTGLTAWLRAFPSTGEWWSGPGEVTITANGSTQQYTGNWTVYRTPSIGKAYFQGSEGRADSEGRVETAHFASLKIDHNANCWAFVMSIEDTEPTFQYVGSINAQLTAMLKPVTTIDPS